MKIILPILFTGLLACAALGDDKPDATKDVLDPVKQKAVWDAEHITFEIEQHFGKRFRAALEARDAKQLAATIHKDFKGSAIASDTAVTKRQKSLVGEYRRGAEGNSIECDANGLVKALLSANAPISTFSGSGFRVLKIAAEHAPGDEQQIWNTRILLTASGKAANGNLAALDSLHDVTFRITSDAQFKEGAAVASWKIDAERGRIAARMLMEEITLAAGLNRIPVADNWALPPGQSVQQFRFQIAVEDFDRDGYLDIALASLQGPTALLRSIKGERFEIANEAFGIPRLSTPAARALACWMDFDNDGFPDLILGDRVYKNIDGKGFEEITKDSGITFPQSPMGCAVADYDGDGLCDLYVLYQFAGGPMKEDEIVPWVGDDSSGAPNTLWRNLGNGRFEDVTEKSQAGGGTRNSFAAAWLYADGDALPDIYVANDFGTNNLLRNRGDGTFEEVAAELGVADFATSMGIASGDIDNDGTPEMYVANMYSKMGRRIIAQVGEDDYNPGVYTQIKGACAGNRLYKSSGKGGVYDEWSEQWGINDIGWAYAPAVADLNNDGLLDLHATTGFLSFERGKPDG